MESDSRTPTTYPNVTASASDSATAIGIGNHNQTTINESEVILRFLSIIEAQNKTIERLQEQLLKLSLRLPE